MLAVVIVDHGSRRPEANDALLELVARFAQAFDFDIVEPAHMEIASPTIADAFDRAVSRGATEIIVHPYFLLPGRHWHEDIPELCARAAVRHTGLRWQVTEPLGLSSKILDVIAERVGAARHSEGGWHES